MKNIFTKIKDFLKGKQDYTFRCNNRNMFVNAALVKGKLIFDMDWKGQKALTEEMNALWYTYLCDVTGRDYVKELEVINGVDSPFMVEYRIVYNAVKSDFQRILEEIRGLR